MKGKKKWLTAVAAALLAVAATVLPPSVVEQLRLAAAQLLLGEHPGQLAE